MGKSVTQINTHRCTKKLLLWWGAGGGAARTPPQHLSAPNTHHQISYNWRMIELTIPGRELIQLEYLVSDVNGTLAVDGQLGDGVAQALRILSDRLEIHLLTADTHGKQILIDRKLGLQAVRIPPGDEAVQKSAYVERLGAASVVAIGQGANDAGMMQAAEIGICIVSAEGTAISTLMAADLVTPDIQTALELLEKPMRLVASLRK